MVIHRPILSNKLTQDFGESKACIEIDVLRQIKRPTRVVGKQNGLCPPGFANMYERMGMKGHNGRDWKVWHGEPCYFHISAPTQWTAKYEKDLDGGVGINVYSREKLDMPNGTKQYVKFRFWHLMEKDLCTTTEREIELGEMIGRCDSTGSSSRDHLHEDFCFVDDAGNTTDKENGFLGKQNIKDYAIIDERFVLEALKRPGHWLWRDLPYWLISLLR